MKTRKALSALLAIALIFGMIAPAVSTASAARITDDAIAIEAPGASSGQEAPAKPLDANAEEAGVTFNVVDYGADPTGVKESSHAVQKALAAAAEEDAATQKTIYFPQGEYHFYAGYSEVRRLYASNTLSWNEAYNLGYQDKYIGILVENMENVTIDGGGSKLIFHGNICTMAAINSKNVTFTNFEQDHASPSVVEMLVESVDTTDNSAIIYIPPCYGYKVNGTSITWVAEGNSPEDTDPYWQLGGPNYEGYGGATFDALSGAPAGGNAPWSNITAIEEIDDTHLKITYSAGKLPTAGRRHQRRNTAPRMTPGVFVSECDNVTFRNAAYRFLHGFGMLLQVTKDVTYDNVTVGGDTEMGRDSGGFADFIHGSTVAGTVTIKNCNFDGAQDDAINIHGTYLQVTGISEDRTKLEVRYMHAEAWGFPQYHVGDTVDFTSQTDMTPVENSTRKVVELCNPGEGTNMDGTERNHDNEHDMRTIIVTLDEAIPEEITIDPANNYGYVMENVTYTPDVVIENNRFANINACGILVTTRKPIKIINNYFDRTSNASIYIAGAAHGYNESGRVEDLLIQGNTFVSNPSSSHFKAQGAIRVQPEDGRGTDANPPYAIYKNVRILDNDFLMMNSTYAVNIDNVDGLTVENNHFLRYDPALKLNLSAGGDGTMPVGGAMATTVEKSAKEIGSKLFRLETCENVTFANNTYDNGLNLGVDLSRGTTAEDVTLTGDALTLGENNKLPAMGTVSYISSDPTVATVNTNGVVTGVKAGTTEIYAYTVAGGRTFMSNPVEVTVKGSSGGAVTGISITGNDTVMLNAEATYTATTVPEGAEVVWAVKPVSEDASAVMTEDGVLTAVAPGLVEVTATAGGVSASKFVTISAAMLDAKWEVVDELEGGWKLDGKTGTLSIDALVSDSDWRTTNDGKNKIVTAVDGDFEATVKLLTPVCQSTADDCYEEAGLVVYQDNNHYVLVGRKNRAARDILAGTAPWLSLVKETSSSAAEVNYIKDPNQDGPLYLKVKKVGNTFTAYYSLDGEAWTQLVGNKGPSYDVTLSNYKVGLYAYGGKKKDGTPMAHPGPAFYDFTDFTLTTDGEAAPVTFVSTNQAPSASAVALTVGESNVTVGYTFTDPENDADENTLIAWYVADVESGPYTRVDDAVGKTLTSTAETGGKWVKAVVAPADAKGHFGAPVISEAVQAPAQANDSSDATLATLSVGGMVLSPAFDAATTAYTVDLPSGVDTVTVTAQTAQAAASITGNGEVTLSGDVTDHVIHVENGETVKDYTITFRRFKSGNSALASLSAGAGENQIAFAEGTRYYYLDGGTADAMTFTAQAADPDATIKVRFNEEERGDYTAGMTLPLEKKLNTLELRVVPASGRSHTIYRVAVLKTISGDTKLKSLRIGGNDVSIGENLDLGPVKVDENVTFEAVASNENASVFIEVDGETVENGQSVALANVYSNATIRVVAENGISERVYTMTLIKLDPNDASLYSLNLDGLALAQADGTEGFDPYVTEYTTSTNFLKDNATLRAVALQSDAKITYETVAEYQTAEGGTITGPCSFFGDVGVPEDGGDPVNTVTVTVTSPNGQVAKTYTVHVTCKNEAWLSELDWEPESTTGWANHPTQKDYEINGAPTKMTLIDPDTSKVVTFDKGLGCHANCQTVYDISGKGYTKFSAKVGLDHSQASNSDEKVKGQKLIFEVLLDGEVVATAENLAVDTPYQVLERAIPTNAKKLTLRATYTNTVGAGAHADWADAKIFGTFTTLADKTIPVAGVKVFKDGVEVTDQTELKVYTNEDHVGHDHNHSLTLTAQVKPDNATNKGVKWKRAEVTGKVTLTRGENNTLTITAVHDPAETNVGPVELNVYAEGDENIKQPLTVQVVRVLENDVSISIQGVNDPTAAPQYGQTLEADINKLKMTDAGKAALTYQWKRAKNGSTTNIGTNSKTYTLTADDVGATISVDVTADPATYYEGTRSATRSQAVVKADRPAITANIHGEKATATDNSDGKIVGFPTDDGLTYEYKLASAADATENWRTVSGAEVTVAAGDYVVRIQATATHNASPTRNVKVGTYDSTMNQVKLAAMTNGSVTRNKPQADPEDTVTLTIVPATGYELDAITVTKDSGGQVTLSGTGNTRAFTMPGEAVTVNATFKKIKLTIDHSGLVNLKCSEDTTGSTHSHEVEYGDTAAITLVPISEYYALPARDTIEIKNAQGVAITGWTINDQGTITFSGGVTSNLTIKATGIVKTYVVNYTLANGLSAPEANAARSVAHKAAYTGTLVAADGYKLPESVAVTMNGEDFTDFTYENGVLTIAEGKIIGNLVIKADGVVKVSVTGVVLSQSTLSLTEGRTAQLTATVTPAEADNKNVTWSSSDEEVATVDETGKVTAVKEGTATITVTTEDGEKTASCVVTVTKPSSGGSSSRPATSTEVTTNPDGSKTTTVTDNRTGTVTATTEKPDGTKEVVETKKDGTVTETVTASDGAKTEKVTDPEENVTITVTDKDGEEVAKVEIPAEIPATDIEFEDIDQTPWAEEAINKVAGLKLVEGTGDNKYAPIAPMTRGALATVLHRLSQGKTDYKHTFQDVAEGKYYTEGVAWAAMAGVVKGFSEDIFAPDQVITREQLAVMLARYAKLIGMDTKADAHRLSVFTDGEKTGEWAVDGVAWCVQNGILQGKGQNNLDPTANVTRAEVAVMLDRFIALLK